MSAVGFAFYYIVNSMVFFYFKLLYTASGIWGLGTANTQDQEHCQLCQANGEHQEGSARRWWADQWKYKVSNPKSSLCERVALYSKFGGLVLTVQYMLGS